MAWPPASRQRRQRPRSSAVLAAATAAAAGRTSGEDGEGGSAESQAEILEEAEKDYDEERGVYVPTEVSGRAGRVVEGSRFDQHA